MEQLNKIELMGRVGIVRSFQGGIPATNFTVATNYVYHGRNGELLEEVTWHNVVVSNAKIVPDADALVKGCSIHVVGRLRSSKYTGADGVERYSYDVQASSVEILDEPLTVQPGY